MSLASSLPSEILDSLERSGSSNANGAVRTSSSVKQSYLKAKRLQSARYDEKRGAWLCRNCGWAYPSPNPRAQDRREHKKHCQEALKVQRWLGSTKFGQDDGGDAQEEVSEQSYSAARPGADLGGPHESSAKRSPEPSDVGQTGTGIAADEENAKADEAIPNERLSSELELAEVNAEKQSTEPLERKADSDDVRGEDSTEDSTHVQHQHGVDRRGQKSRDQSKITGEVEENRKRKVSEGSGRTEKPEITEDNPEKEATLERENRNSISEGRQTVEEIETPITPEDLEPRRTRGRVQERQDVEAGQTSERRTPYPSARRNWDDWEDVVRDEATEGSGALQLRQENDTAARNWEGWEDLMQGEALGGGTPFRREEDRAARNWEGWDDVVSQPDNVYNISVDHKSENHVEHSTRDPGATSQRHAKEVPCPAKLQLAAMNWDDWEDVIMTGSTLNLQSLKPASLTSKDVAVTS